MRKVEAEAHSISRLPKWAQDEMTRLERERNTAIQKLNDFIDNQTISNIFTEDWVCTGEEQSPSQKRYYIQSDSITIRVGKEEIDFRVLDTGAILVNGGRAKLTARPVAANSLELRGEL